MTTAVSLVFKGLSVNAVVRVGQISVSSDHSSVTFTVLKYFTGSDEPFDSEAFTFEYSSGVDVVAQCEEELTRRFAV